jgi:hypothetical protein
MANLTKKTIALSVCCFLISLNTAFSQDSVGTKQNTESQKLTTYVYLLSGQLEFLNNAQTINIEFRNDTTTAGRMKEVEYIKIKVHDLNEKRSGKGDEWLAEWMEKRAQGEKSMILSLNKALKKRNITFQKDLLNAKYTLLVNVIKIEEGWNAGLVSGYAEVGLDLHFFETPDKSKEVANLFCFSLGKAGNLPHAYYGAGFQLGRAISKNLPAKK